MNKQKLLRPATISLVLLAITIGGCRTMGPAFPGTNRIDEPVLNTGSRNYLEKGPTMGVEEVRMASPSPLEMLELTTLELDNSREEIKKLRESLRSMQRERDDLKSEYTRLNTLYSDLLRTHDLAEAAQQEIMEKVLMLKLDKVRLEKEILQLKLEGFVEEMR